MPRDEKGAPMGLSGQSPAAGACPTTQQGSWGHHTPLWGQATLGHLPRAGARIRPNEDPLQAHSLAWELSLQDSWWWPATCLPHWPGFSVRVVLWLYWLNPDWDWNTEVLLSSLIIQTPNVFNLSKMCFRVYSYETNCSSASKNLANSFC